MKENKYCLEFLQKDSGNFRDVLRKAIESIPEFSYFTFICDEENFSKYESILTYIMSGIISGKNRRKTDCYFRYNDDDERKIHFKIEKYTPETNSFDISVYLTPAHKHYGVVIQLDPIILVERKDNVKFIMPERTLKKCDYDDSVWKVIEKIFGFESAEEIRLPENFIQGTGILPEKKS
jgi:hypothetical protein